MILTMLWVVSKLLASEVGSARATVAAQLLLEKVPLQHEPSFFRINWLQFCPCCIKFCVLNSISLCLALSSLWYLNLRVEMRRRHSVCMNDYGNTSRYLPRPKLNRHVTNGSSCWFHEELHFKRQKSLKLGKLMWANCDAVIWLIDNIDCFWVDW